MQTRLASARLTEPRTSACIRDYPRHSALALPFSWDWISVALPESTTGTTTLRGGALVARSCPICGSNRETRVFAEASAVPETLTSFAFASRKVPENLHHRIVECEECDVLYSSPVPTREFLEAAYRDASFDASEESRLASVTYGRFLPRIARSLSDKRARSTSAPGTAPSWSVCSSTDSPTSWGWSRPLRPSPWQTRA